jgi:hypothetical protein
MAAADQLDAGDGLDRKFMAAFVPRLAKVVASAAAPASRQARQDVSEHLLAAVPGPPALAALSAGWGRRLVRERP